MAPDAKRQKLESQNQQNHSLGAHSRVSSYIWKSILYIVVAIITTILGERGVGMLSDFPPKALFAIILFCVCVYLGWGVWVLTGWISRRYSVVTFRKRILITGILVFVVLFAPPTYKGINLFTRDLGSIQMNEFGDNSQSILVHYGTRPVDTVSTNTTLGQLKEKPRAALTINGEDILFVHTAEKKVFVDVTLFGGYSRKAFFDLPLARTNDFEISMNLYFNMNAPQQIVRESLGGYIADPVTCKELFDTILAPPIAILDNDYDKLPIGWNHQYSAKRRVITNEYGIPVYVLQYKNPYEITISGLFFTEFGLLKVDNSQDVTFSFGSNLSDLGEYKVDNIFVNSFLDFFISEKSYDLSEDYMKKDAWNVLVRFYQKLFNIPNHEEQNLVIRPTYYPAINTHSNGLLIEFSKKWDDIDPVSIIANIQGARVEGQYAWWAIPNQTGFNLDEITTFRKGVLADAFSGSSNISPPVFEYHSLGKPLSDNTSLYLWFVSPEPLVINDVYFQNVHFYRSGNDLILDKK